MNKRTQSSEKKKKCKLPYCVLFATGVSSDFLSTEKEIDTLICYLYGLEVIQD